MDSEEEDYSELNQSKFMSEQVNWDEQPTQEEIIEKAEELGIDDYKLAREALLKELNPQWKPYMNRYGQVYYINLEEKKGYTDHPIDMEYKITYALKFKKKLPSFKEYKFNQISQDPRIILREIVDYEKQKGLNIVYEESDQQSIRKRTMRSNEDEEPQDFKELSNRQMEREIAQYRLQQQRQLKKSLIQYRRQQQSQYNKRVKQHEDYKVQLKNARLQDIGDVYSNDIDQKNQTNYQKSIETTILELENKKRKVQDMLEKEMQLTEQLHSYHDRQLNYKRLAKLKTINIKRKQRDKCYRNLDSYMMKRVMEELYEEEKEFNQQLQVVTRTKINLQEIFDRNLAEINTQQLLIKKKKRFSIFWPEIFPPNPLEQKVTLPNGQTIEHEQVWSANIVGNSFNRKFTPSLSLRLYKKIL